MKGPGTSPSTSLSSGASDPQEPHSPSRPTGRTLVLCFDGTSNMYDDTNTNVVRLFSFLEKEDPSRQLVYYQSGVGTSVGPQFVSAVSRWVAKTVDLAIAFSLDTHVMNGYKFLQATYEEGDRICLFGFSRGAYTARALAGMLYTVGLLPRHMVEEVEFAYSIYRHEVASAAYKRDFSRTVRIEFIGVWDTVSSVGALIPRMLPFSADNHITKIFRHALSLDERRAAFRCNPWQRTTDNGVNHSDGRPHVGIVRTVVGGFFRGIVFLWRLVTFWKKRKAGVVDTEHVKPLGGETTHVKEVWFAGCHGDVGGGSVENEELHSLANIPLSWMIKEILEADPGILFRPDERLVELGIILPERAVQPKFRSAPGVGLPPNTNEGAADDGSSPTRTSADGSRVRKKPITGSSSTDSLGPVVLSDGESRLDQDDLPSPYLPVNYDPEDVIAPIHDELKVQPAWCILEFLPFLISKQDSHDRWRTYPRINFFRPRDIPPPPAENSPNSSRNPTGGGVNISDAPALFHVSVQARTEATEAKRRLSKSWFKPKVYRPLAHLPSGKPKFVR